MSLGNKTYNLIGYGKMLGIVDILRIWVFIKLKVVSQSEKYSFLYQT